MPGIIKKRVHSHWAPFHVNISALVSAGFLSFSINAFASSGSNFSLSSLVPSALQTVLQPQSATTYDLTLQWGSVPNASHYRLEQSTDGGVTYSPLTPTALTSQTLTLNAGEYKFKVSGCIEDVANSQILCDGIGNYSNEYAYDTNNPPTNNATLDWAQMGGAVTSASLVNKTVSATNFNGATPGDAGVSGGAAVYNIPIVVPPGRNGMQPQVALNYSSRSGNGIAGVGWNLSAGSSIGRCPATVAQDGMIASVDYTNTDRLCLDGQRLMVVSGTYGATGAEYRTEIESLVSVVQSGGYNTASASFTVSLPNGAKRFYGQSSNSRVVASGKNAPLSWLIEREEDAGGNNSMDYAYSHQGDGEVLLHTIKYTGTQTTSGNREVRFAYQNRARYSTQYLSGGKTRTTQRLTQISTWYAGSKVRDYTLDYGVASTASGRSLLRSVTECGYLGGGSLCRSPSTFSWLESKPRFQIERFQTDTGIDIFPPYIDTSTGSNIELAQDVSSVSGDMNGDGVRDWSGSYLDAGVKKPVTYFLNAEGQETASAITPLNITLEDHLASSRTNVNGDFNLDGRTDRWQIHNGLLRIGYTEENSPGVFSSNYTGTTTITMQTGVTEDAVASVSDYNGDGWPDIVISSTATSFVSGAVTANYYLHLHTKDLATPYVPNSTAFYTASILSSGRGISAGVGSDINGDGIPDITVSKHFKDQYRPVLETLLITQVSAAGVVTFDAHDINFDNVTNDTVGHYSTLLDINGDGLNDWVGWLGYDHGTSTTHTLRIKLNQGNGTFSAAMDTGFMVPGVIEESIAGTGGGEILDSAERYVPARVNMFKMMDVDNNGTTEILLPGIDEADIVARHCLTFKYYDPGAGVFAFDTKCGNDIPNFQYRPTEANTHKFLRYSQDKSIRKMHAWHFVENSSGNITIETAPTDIIGSGSGSVVMDAFGKGLQDVLFVYGCTAPANCSYNAPVAGSALEGGAYNHVYINRNYGATENTGTLGATDYQPVDMLKNVSNGVGLNSQWIHRPLSSDQYDSTYASFYQTNFPDVVDGEPRGKQIHFASSMYSVAEFSQSNGVGGLNATRYQYDGAVYDIQGRGFRGFNGITEIDLVNGATTYTDFKQTFPFSSAVEAQYRFEGTNVDVNSTAEQNQALTQSTNNWLENPSQKGLWKSGGVYQLYNSLSYAINRTPSTDGLGKGAFISESKVKVLSGADIDQYGNIKSKTTEVRDDYGTYTTVENADYSLANDSWPNRYSSRTVTRNTVNRTASGITSVPTGTDSNKVLKTEVTWNTTHRKPGTVVVKKDGITSITTTSTVYNDYGLPTQVTVIGDVIEGVGDATAQQSRKVTTNYTNNGTVPATDGYFPYEITQYASAANLHVTTTQTDARTGLPTSVNDVAGVVTSTAYDALARPVSITRTGFPVQHIRYLSALGDGLAPYDAKMSIQTFQQGVPDSREYKDMLGRTLKVATQGFDARWIFQETHYSARGLVTHETPPYYYGDSYTATQYKDHDVLGRVQNKITPQTNGQLNTTYSYNGLSTDITVAATVSDVPNLVMSRTYNALEQLVETVDAMGGTTQYAYDGAGNPIVIRDANAAINNNQSDIVASYDALGRKDYVNDPNQGITHFTYNDFGELEKEVDANNQIIRYDMDLLGRVTSRNGDGATASFTWDTLKKGLLTSQSQGASSKSYQYDSAARITRSDVVIDGTTYRTLTEYDNNHGRPLSMTYPGRDLATPGIKIEYMYNATGYLTQERNANTQFVYREVTAQDAFGNIQNANLNGNSLTGEYLYHQTTGQMLHSKVQAGAASPLHHIGYNSLNSYDSYGNLRKQENLVTNSSDSFTYDALHRLVQSGITVGGTSANIDYAYDAVGNILKKSDYSANAANAYTYSNGTNQIASITLKDSGGTVTFGYDSKGNQTHRNGTQEVTYNVFNKPLTINKNGSDITLDYGADLARYKQTRIVDGKTITTHYIDKHYEVEIEGTNYTRKSYLGDVAIFTDSDTDGITISYTHRDRLGSAATFTDHNNIVKARRHFDPFGKPRGGDWSELMPPQLNANLLDTIMGTRRGFTDHEHLDEAELIHMNGRVYDYNVGRFMSVDPVIQSPTNTQSVNPYSYIMNNPMSGTDPTGYAGECPKNATCEDIKEASTGSRIKKKVGTKITQTTTKNGITTTITAKVMSNGSISGTVSSTGGGISFSRGFTADIGNQGGIAKTQSGLEGSGKPNKAGFIEKAINFLSGSGFVSHEEAFAKKSEKFGSSEGCKVSNTCINKETIKLYTEYTAGVLAANSPGQLVINSASKMSQQAFIRTVSAGPNFGSHKKLIEHFSKHGVEFGAKSAGEYLLIAREVMKRGFKVRYLYKGEYRIGYVQLMGTTAKGRAKFAFVGTNNSGKITTLHVKRAKDAFKTLNGNAKENVIKPVN